MQSTKFFVIVQKTWMPKSSKWRTRISFPVVLTPKLLTISTSDPALPYWQTFPPYWQLARIYLAWSLHLSHGYRWDWKPSFVQVIAGEVLTCIWTAVPSQVFSAQGSLPTCRLMLKQDKWGTGLEPTRSMWGPKPWRLAVLWPGYLVRAVNLCSLQKNSQRLFT